MLDCRPHYLCELAFSDEAIAYLPPDPMRGLRQSIDNVGIDAAAYRAVFETSLGAAGDFIKSQLAPDGNGRASH